MWAGLITFIMSAAAALLPSRRGTNCRAESVLATEKADKAAVAGMRRWPMVL